ncbi:MAG: hypothetical protein LWY06_15420 [Firmicutes bacterium]|nr:hypothetical protein [Bacillota bacterium]
MSVNTRNLTERQRAILRYIKKYITRHGYPPAVRDICKGVGLASSSSVHFHLNSLEKLGFIERDSSKTRAIRPIIDKSAPPVQDEDEIKTLPEAEFREQPAMAGEFVPYQELQGAETVSISDENELKTVQGSNEEDTEELTGTGLQPRHEESSDPDLVLYPLLNGNLTGAGADFDIDFVPMPTLLVGQGEGFLVTYHGDSMIEAGMGDGDLCIVKKNQEFEDGDILAVIHAGEIVIKRVYTHTDGFILESANPSHVTMIVKELEILGKVTGLIRIPIQKAGKKKEF